MADWEHFRAERKGEPLPMPPTDKALAVMTPDHLNQIGWAKREAQRRDYSGTAFLLSQIESLVRYLVAHPERLAGEGQSSTEEIGKLIESFRAQVSARASGSGVWQNNRDDIYRNNLQDEEVMARGRLEYAIAHLRLAGEDEVVVKREEYDAQQETALELRCTKIISADRGNSFAKLREAVLPIYNRHQEANPDCACALCEVMRPLEGWIAEITSVSPTAQESKEK